jgi:hypothetical protein
MAAIDVDAIWEALRERLAENAPSFKAHTRKPKAQYGIEEYPVLEVWDNGDETLADPFAPEPTWKLTGEIVILAYPEGEDIPNASVLNPLVREVRDALERKDSDPLGDGSFYVDLGGKVRALALTKVAKGLGETTGKPQAVLTVELYTNPPHGA